MDPKGEKTTIFKMPSDDATMPDMMGALRIANPTLTIIKGPNTGTTFTLEDSDITIGRDPESSVFLNDMTVSRNHAKLNLTSDGASIVDLRSLNGTWVDGAIINESKLEDGSTIQIGTFRMIYHTEQVTGKIAQQ